jgi:ribosomal protein S18 acetylase RimI-like enzyme
VISGTNLIVSLADASDREALFEVFVDVESQGGAVPRRDRPLREVFEDGWLRDRTVYAARRDGQTVGGYFIRSNFPAFAAHIAQGGYLVARDFRRQGIGRALLEHSLAQAASDGYRAMMFNLVMAGNPSRLLYESVGFRVIGEIPQVHGDQDGLIYWRSLDNAQD